ncbi:hypothetical protein MINTM015_26610 [Mycobacterium paraintracellulare]|nr:hypothetical protein MINTM015_26610 [Mycobacterium paraintracellulare]
MRRVANDVNALVTGLAAFARRAASRSAARVGGASGRVAPTDRAGVGPDNDPELRKRPEPRGRPRGSRRRDAVVARGAGIGAGDKIRARLKVRVCMPNSAAYPAEGGRVSTL